MFSRENILEEKRFKTNINRDSLTNIYNRGYAFERLGQSSIELFLRKRRKIFL